jgi:hypothetical protein
VTIDLGTGDKAIGEPPYRIFLTAEKAANIVVKKE